MLVLTPTRELAVQVHGVIEELGRPMQVRTAVIYGGVGFEKQTRDLRQGRAVIVATPGRLMDHMGRGNVRFDHLAILVLDEADRMLDMGFLPDIQYIVRKLPRDRQTMMFAATFPDEIVRLAKEMQRDPERINVGRVAKPVEAVRQLLYAVMPEDKSTLLMQLLRENDIASAVVFLRTKSRTDRLEQTLRKAGLKAAAIHGDLSQRQREHALEGFRGGKYRVLVATDVAARGLDIDGISHVINYDIPPTADDYIHRIGRTARASAEGDAITFVSPSEALALEVIERALGRRLPRQEWEKAPPVLSLFRPPEEDTAEKRALRRRSPRRLLRRR
jgi:ATP-dependent RNA helicase RhlE